jgi:hypothetical protein
MAQSSGCDRATICNYPYVSSTQPRPRRPARWPWHPFLFAVGWILANFVDSGVHAASTLRALVIVLAAMVGLAIILRLLVRRWSIAGIVATGLFGILVASDPVASLWIAAAFIVATAGYLLAKGTVARSLDLDDLTGLLNVFGVLLIALIGLQGLTNGTIAAIPGDLLERLDPPRPAQDSPPNVPDIYIIVMDGYPRADTVANRLGGDNTSFVSALEDRGFTVARNSTSGYMYTDLAFTSLFHGRHLVDIPELGPLLDGANQPSLDRQILNDAPMLRLFREEGYSTIANAQAWDEPALRDVDVYVDGSGVNEFERHLIRGTLIGSTWEVADEGLEATLLAPWVHDAFSFLAAAPDVEVPGPRLVFTHIPSPHFPVIFTEAGDRAATTFATAHPSQVRAAPEMVRRAYLDQVAYLNRTLMATLDSMDLPDDAIVIVMSDHGPEFGLHWFDEENTEFDVRFASFFAAKNASAFPDDVQVSDVFAILAREVLDEPIELPARRFFSNEAEDKFRTLKEVADPWG